MNALNTITNFMYMPFDDSGQGYECPLSHRGTAQPFLRQPLKERLRSPPFVRWCRERQLLGAQTESLNYRAHVSCRPIPAGDRPEKATPKLLFAVSARL